MPPQPQSSTTTIFLTPTEATRISTTAKARLQKCKTLANTPRESRDTTSAIQAATGASLMADMGGAPDPDMAQTDSQEQGAMLPVIVVGQPYPPCRVPVEELAEIGVAELQMETHHRGKKLTVKRVSPVVTLAARSWAMVQDEAKETERIEMVLHKDAYGEDILESTKSFVIKDPYFTLTEQGEPTLRIDHPSDLVPVHEPAIKKDPGDDAAAQEKAAKKCKDQGNTALKEQDYHLALALYTEGLEIASRPAITQTNPDLARDIARNRAHLNLLLSRYDAAHADALRSLISNAANPRSASLDAKAFFRAGSALYALGRWTEAQVLFEKQRALAPGDRDAKSYLSRVASRLAEQETGSYNLTSLRAGISLARPNIDAASFTRHTEIRSSPSHGRGLFATRDFEKGELVLTEQAWCVVWDHERSSLRGMTFDVRDEKIRVVPLGLGRAVVRKLVDNASQRASIGAMFGDYTGVALDRVRKADKEEEAEPVDIHAIHDIIARNAFGPFSPLSSQTLQGTALYPHASTINHSCDPTLTKSYISSLLLLHATRPIAAGTELTHAYSLAPDLNDRRAALELTWGFTCRCPVCAAEEVDGQEVRAERAKLEKQAEVLVGGVEPGKANAAVVRRAKRLAGRIEESYGEGWKGLPRLSGVGVRGWLDAIGKR